MTKPTILTVDDDPLVSQAITRDLQANYATDYRIVRVTSGAEALAILAELALRGRQVALIATDQRMPDMTGIELLQQARSHAPDAKLLLLTAYADTDVAIKAINDIGLDYYLLKPWDPPAERLYPVIDDLLGDWQSAHPQDTGDVRVVGHRWSERSHEVKTFLARNHVPYRWLDIDRHDEARRLQGSRRPRSTISRWCLHPTARSSGPRRRSTWPVLSACGPGPSNRSTTCASSAVVPRGLPPRCTPRPKGCGPSWWSGRRPVARRPERLDRELPRLPEGRVRC